jgi:signal transduction histidine kinase/ketosteroid isomerase-like protein
MKLTKKTETEVLKVYDSWLHAYLNGDVAIYNQYLDDAYHFIGSTNNEEFLDRNATTNFFEATADQLAGKCQLKEEKKTVEAFGDLVFITHVFDAWFLNGSEWTYYSRFRFSSVVQEKKTGWRFIYQHFSTTDNKADEGETIGFDKVTLENQELREAIKRRTVELEAKNRELEIEGALERIRAQAVAMQQSSDLLDIVVTMRNEFTKLGHEAHYFWHMMWLPETYEKAMTSDDGSKIGFVMTLPRHMHGDIPLLANWEESDDATVIYPMNVKAAISYVDKMVNNLGNFKNIDPQAPTHDDIKHIGGLTFIMARTTHGEIGYSLPGVIKNPPAEDLDILVQFAGAFDLAHRRFLDLQKAEKQAREVQIELALEKVRSRTMAMHKTDELREVAAVLYKEIESLHMSAYGFELILFKPEKDLLEYWTVPPNYEFTERYKIHRNTHPVFEKQWVAWENKEERLVIKLKGQELDNFNSVLFSETDFRNFPEAVKLKIFEKEVTTFSHAYMRYGFLEAIDNKQLSENDFSIISRFAKVFEQTYTRFLDIQKAEKQAREAQIEGALERVRSRSLAMYNSEELLAVIEVVSEQLRLLDLKFDTISFGKNYQESDFKFWLTSSGQPKPVLIQVPFFDSRVLKSVIEAQKKEIDFIADVFTKEENRAWLAHMIQFSALKNFPEHVKDFILNSPGFARSSFLMQHIDLYVGNYRAMPFTDEENAIFKRFAQVFSQAYTRFLDLQKAEDQARESQIQLSLERVRAKSMAMQSSSELENIIQVVHDQFVDLGITLDHAGFIIDYKSNDDMIIWLADEHKVTPQIRLPYFDSPHWNSFITAKRQGHKLFVNHLDFKTKNKFYKQIFKYIPELPEDARHFYLKIPSLTIATALIDTIGLYIENFSGVQYQEEDQKILFRFGEEFQQAFTRFLDLQKAEAQAREAQIQLSLERVRAKSMAMQSSDELHDVIGIVFQQFDNLAIQPVNVFLSLFDREKRMLTYRASGKSGKRMPTKQDVDIDSVEAWTDLYNKWINDSSDDIEVIFYPKEIVPDILNLLKATFLAMPKKDRMTTKDFPNGGYSTLGYTPFGYLGYDHTRPPTEEEKDILKRICTEFGRVYQRFLDIKKAEAQAREAQIEMALERVRSRTMAMQNSEELEEVILVVLKKLQGLGISMEQRAAAIFTYEAGNKDYTQWVASPEYNSILSFNTPYFDHPVQNDIWNARQNRTDFYAKPYPVEVKNSLFKYLFDLPALKNMPQAEKTKALNFKHYSISIAFQKHASLVVVDHSGVPLTEAENSILVRLNYVFHQTYTRFLDLQKAEAQAREAQIEAALEKVRSRSMGMQKSTELLEVILVVSEQLQALGFRFSTASFLNNNLEDNYSFWVAPYGLPEPVRFTLPYKDIPMIRKLRNAQKKKLSFFTDVSSIKEHQQWFQHLLDYSKENTYTKEIIDYQMSKGLARSVSIHPNIMLAIANNQSLPYSDYENKIIARFGQVFEQSYTRFLDLEKAEAQAREAQIEAALEKVRSRSLEMSESSEMQNVANEILVQVRAVGLKIDALAMSGVIDNDSDYDVWVGGANSKKPLRIPYNNETQVQREFNKAIKERPEFFAKTYTGKVIKDYFKALMGTRNSFNPEIVAFMKTCTGFTTTLTFMKNSGIQLIRYSEEAFSKEDNAVIVRFGRVFEQAYIRFLDLQKAEEQTLLAQQNLIRLQTQKQRAEEALSELQQTQTQLIQSEKMASLGELTAGIAHEIQNPLNFVNNFSEVSKELLVEMQEEIENGDFEEVKAIMEDVIQNLEKINHHGKRADGIVKGMLQHSRSSSGTKEPTDINALADEYLRLAYHGLRAKDKSFNAELVTDFDNTIGKIHVIPQDIGRVILNLITNGFYAVNEKKQKDEDYKPIVSVSTKKIGDYLEIKVTDNGNGIPKEVVDKIFQPFFTTKPTGQGTGLGLSLSYDIVKAHGGSLTVISSEGKGSEFSFTLPALA